MSNHNTPEAKNQISEQPSSFNSSEDAPKVSVNPNAPHDPTQYQTDPETANSAPPDDLGGLVDPNLENLSDGT